MGRSSEGPSLGYKLEEAACSLLPQQDQPEPVEAVHQRREGRHTEEAVPVDRPTPLLVHVL